MSVRAKLQCVNVEDNVGIGLYEKPIKTGENVAFSAIYSDTPEDNTFSKFTPSADFTMFVSNPDMYGRFIRGKSYFFDITPAE